MNRHIFLNLSMILIRSALALRFLLSNTTLGTIYGISEAFCIFSTIRGTFTLHLDETNKALAVPFLYLAPLLFSIPKIDNITHPWLTFLLIQASITQIFLRARMGWNVTVGVPMFNWLLHSGPYRLIRHPLALSEIWMCLVYLLCVPTDYNFGIWIVCICAALAAIEIEESFLRHYKQYRTYARVVRYKLIPGLY